jgi:hypothetical protein
MHHALAMHYKDINKIKSIIIYQKTDLVESLQRSFFKERKVKFRPFCMLELSIVSSFWHILTIYNFSVTFLA